MKAPRVLLMLALAAAYPAAHAQTGKWPDKSVRVVAPFAAGGSTDIIARQLTARLSQEYGQQFVVDNRGGAGGAIGAEIVARAAPDGYTLIIVATSYATNAALYKLAYDPVKDIAPVAKLHHGPFLVALHSSVNATTIRALIDLARAKPRTLNYGSSGIVGASHLATELFTPPATGHAGAAARRRQGAGAQHARGVPARDLARDRQMEQGGQGRQYQGALIPGKAHVYLSHR